MIIGVVFKHTITLIANEAFFSNFSTGDANIHTHCHILNHNLLPHYHNIVAYSCDMHVEHHVSADCFHTSNHHHLNVVIFKDAILQLQAASCDHCIMNDTTIKLVSFINRSAHFYISMDTLLEVQKTKQAYINQVSQLLQFLME